MVVAAAPRDAGTAAPLHRRDSRAEPAAHHARRARRRAAPDARLRRRRASPPSITISTASAPSPCMQPTSGVFAEWRRTVSREATVFVATSVVLVILGFAYHAQTARAHEADFIYAATQTRVHTALRRGRSGLWEWDLSRGAIFWSPSMFEILGLEPENRLLSVGEVAALTHPDDVDLVGARRTDFSTPAKASLDREFRMRHADGALGLDSRPRRGRRRCRGRAASRRHRRRRDRAAAARRGIAHRRHAAARRDRGDLRGLRAVGRVEPPGALQQQVPAALRPARRAGAARHALFGDQARTAAAPIIADDLPAAKAPARARSRRGSRTGAGCRSTSGAPTTAASSPSAPTSPR